MNRLPQIDALRGFALLGICMVNAPIISGAWHLATDPATASVDHTAAWLVTALVTTKFYLIFSFLFGYSFTLQQVAADRSGVSFSRRHGRRLLGLFLIGFGHAILLYPGDILMTYAVLGLALLALRGLGARAALLAAIVLIAFLATVMLLAGVMSLGTGNDAHFSADAVAVQQSAAYRGGPLSIIHANITNYRHQLGGVVLYSIHLLAALLTGMAAGRLGWLDPSRGIRAGATVVRRRICVVGLLFGLPGGVLTAMCTYGPFGDRFYYLGQAVDVITAPLLAAAYGTALLALLRGRFGHRIARILAPAGRMSLSLYLLQSGVLAFVFTGYGFGLYGEVGPAALALGCIALWAAQLALSARLMARVRYGPVELMLRRITLGPAALRAARAAGPLAK
ncbi:DUF418 domain-containing protein [Streptomyces mirabilis]|uniref:DUF418 domain-containing protein n=1 Tax=Streptomyces mirabilis TaxID=68239 RepID=UPI0036B7DA07